MIENQKQFSIAVFTVPEASEPCRGSHRTTCMPKLRRLALAELSWKSPSLAAA